MPSELSPRPLEQKEKLTHVVPENIPTGATIPEKVFEYYLHPGSFVLDAGGGTGGKALALQSIGLHPIVLDVNPLSITEAKSKGLVAYVSDVTKFEIPIPGNVLSHMEKIDGVIMEALLCNLMDEDWKRAVTAAHISLAPDGYLFVADVLRADQQNPVLEQELTQEQLQVFREDWEKRYTVNAELGLPFGTFVVAHPDKNKDNVERGSVEDLKRLLASSQWERYARHFEEKELEPYITGLGFSVQEKQYTVWHSRTGRPLSGIRYVFKKDDKYRYHWLHHGKTRDEVIRNLVKEDLSMTDEQIIAMLSTLIPDPHHHLPSLFPTPYHLPDSLTP